MAAALDRFAYEALPVAKSSAPFDLTGIERAEKVVGGPVVLVTTDNALFRVPPTLESVATAAHVAVVNGTPLPSKPGRLDRLLEKLASSPVAEDAKPVDVLVEHIADRLDENGALSGILALVADEIATKMKTSELVAALASEFEEEVAKKLPRMLFDRVINPKGSKRRRISLDQSRLT
jgi:ribosomal protein L10